MGRWIARWVGRVLVALVLTAAVTYIGDWAVWRMRVSSGSGYGSMRVSRFVVAQLKGNKVEYYPDGSGQEQCSRSIFGQGGTEACWWMARHPVVLE